MISTELLMFIDAMERRLDDDPEDWGTRAVLADACEEAGRGDWSAYYRWTVANRKRPLPPSEHPWEGFEAMRFDDFWRWLSTAAPEEEDVVDPSSLIGVLDYDELKGNAYWWRSRRSAESWYKDHLLEKGEI